MAKITVDFSNVKERGEFNPQNLHEGDYHATIKNAVLTESKQGNPQVLFTISPDQHPRASYPYYCGLDEKQLWKLRNVIQAVGMKAPKSKISIDTDRLIGKKLGIELVDDEYDGRMKSVINAVFTSDSVNEGDPSEEPDEDFDDDDEDEAPAPKAKARKKVEPVVEEDDDEDDEDDDEEEEPAPVKKRVVKKKAPEPEPEDDDEEDEDEEPEPAPKKRVVRKKKAAPVVEDEDDIEELEIDEL